MNLFLTPIGQSKLTQSLANPNEPLVFSKMVIGDWNGDDLSPLDKNRTALVHEVYRAKLDSKKFTNNQLEVMMVVPTTTGGYTVREVGLLDDDDQLVAIGRYPNIYKTLMTENPSIIDIYVVLALSDNTNTTVSFSNDNVYVFSSVFDSTVEMLSSRTINGKHYDNTNNIDVEDKLYPTIPSATTTRIGDSGGTGAMYISGSTNIQSLGVSTTGIRRTLMFTGILTLTYSATSLILPTNADIITAVGDIAEFICIDGNLGYWVCVNYRRRNGTPVTLGNLNTLGNAATATKLATSRNISIDGEAETVTTGFDGSANVNLTISLIASAVLAKLKTVDGTGSGLDADLLDGEHISNILLKNNETPYLPGNQYHPATKKYVDDMAQSSGGNVNITIITKYTATAGQTSFAVTYIPGSLNVTLNGLELDNGLDFTAVNGTSITLTTGAVVGDIVRITAYGGADVYNKSQANALYAIKLGIAENAVSASKTKMDAVGSTCAELFSNTPANYSSMKEINGIADAPNTGWWFIKSIRHSDASNQWGTQIAYGWENNANVIYQRNISAGTWSTWRASSFVSGMIMIWSGSAASIPVGWALCDGGNGTPNLQDRFVVGAGSAYGVGATGGRTDAIVPSHYHWFNANTNGGGVHRHGGYSNQNLAYSAGGGRANDAPNGYATSGRYWETLDGGNHTHYLEGNTAWSGESNANQNLPPFYALCYIMKL